MLNFYTIFIIYLAAVNIAAYFLMYRDKQQAKKKAQRTAENVFFLLSFMGGFIGLHLTMQHFRHKTLHRSFKLVVIISALFWLIFLPFSLYWVTY
ncbi:uncharacterized membrane protein YsdA (DUF1294 family) [Cricetibacter osteomyelitidis]|uniref:Uncharacterized membrane protein YsdA (DUF1294 family) n=1 Tax=Cricetibacter osteomyelitidis TaxID=1521931 RepID=A0A4R2SZS2_9PAST|nr:DUF1294 domain-containing protein [Cricetibacter osteomyelitidis]TCP95065.1 uncharacterized membrane protein YsdA (DUF1294 family) [Cricetibacter osteomyelitidis]